MPLVAQRLNNLPPYVFAVIGERIRAMQTQGIDVIRLDIGSPDLPPPEGAVDSLALSANQPGNHGYSGYRGIPEFRKAVARYYQRRFGVALDPEKEVLPLLGSKEGIVNLCLAYLDRGDVNLVPDIGYPSYSQGARLAGAEICWLPMREENGFFPSLESIPGDFLKRAKLLWVNYPNNPTGAVAEMEFYTQMVEFCKAHNVLLVSDNPYCDVTFDGYTAMSALQATNARDCTVELMSFSKTYNMGGWRLGAAVGYTEALANLLQVKSNMDSGHFRAVYDAGITVLDETPQSWIDWRNAVYQRRRDCVLDALPHIGLRALRPKGSIYIWAKTETMDDRAYVEQALNIAHVSLAPGAEYGPGGEGYVRFSLGVPDDRLALALERLKRWYAAL
jgi:LL-diaminopimelate aminotransferase